MQHYSIISPNIFRIVRIYIPKIIFIISPNIYPNTPILSLSPNRSQGIPGPEIKASVPFRCPGRYFAWRCWLPDGVNQGKWADFLGSSTWRNPRSFEFPYISFTFSCFYFGMLKISGAVGFLDPKARLEDRLEGFGLQLELDASHVELGLCDEEIVPNVWPYLLRS